jgi:hypothetical protein
VQVIASLGKLWICESIRIVTLEGLDSKSMNYADFNQSEVETEISHFEISEKRIELKE